MNFSPGNRTGASVSFHAFSAGLGSFRVGDDLVAEAVDDRGDGEDAAAGRRGSAPRPLPSRRPSGRASGETNDAGADQPGGARQRNPPGRARDPRARQMYGARCSSCCRWCMLSSCRNFDRFRSAL